MKGTGFVAFDLTAPARLIYPVFTPIRNRIPRNASAVLVSTSRGFHLRNSVGHRWSLPSDWLELVVDEFEEEYELEPLENEDDEW